MSSFVFVDRYMQHIVFVCLFLELFQLIKSLHNYLCIFWQIFMLQGFSDI